MLLDPLQGVRTESLSCCAFLCCFLAPTALGEHHLILLLDCSRTMASPWSLHPPERELLKIRYCRRVKSIPCSTHWDLLAWIQPCYGAVLCNAALLQLARMLLHYWIGVALGAFLNIHSRDLLMYSCTGLVFAGLLSLWLHSVYTGFCLWLCVMPFVLISLPSDFSPSTAVSLWLVCISLSTLHLFPWVVQRVVSLRKVPFNHRMVYLEGQILQAWADMLCRGRLAELVGNFFPLSPKQSVWWLCYSI